MPLPDYTVRHSPKAKNLRLKVTPEHGLCVVIPKGFDEKKLPTILERKKIWIADALKRASETRRFLEPRPANHLPNSLQLLALGETWGIVYRENGATTRIQLRAVNGELTLSGSNLTR